MHNLIDLHLHTNASDGADTPAALLETIRAEGIHTFSVTDHDTMDGALEMETLNLDGLQYIRGIEFSCVTPHKKCHILGYGFDHNDPLFQEALDLCKQLRRKKVEGRIRYWAEHFGIVLTEEESNWIRSQGSVGKPHFGNIILNRGLAPDLRTAIKDYVNTCKVPDERIDAEMAVKAIVHAGGVPVWAHPLGGENEKRLTKAEFYAQLDYLAKLGVRALECHYSRYTWVETEFLLDQAKKYDLMVSAGSDYHGANKPNLHAGKLNEEDTIVEPDQLSLYQHLSTR